VRLAYEEGRESMEKIAKRMNIPLGTIKSWRMQARKSSFMQTWDRRNGEARRHAKKLENLPQLKKHVLGTSYNTQATAAMLADVPKSERFLLLHAIQEVVCSDSDFLENRERMIAKIEAEPVSEHLDDAPDEVKVLVWQASRLASNLLGQLHTAISHMINGSAFASSYTAYPNYSPQHQERTCEMIQQLRDSAAAQMEPPTQPNKFGFKSLNSR